MMQPEENMEKINAEVKSESAEGAGKEKGEPEGKSEADAVSTPEPVTPVASSLSGQPEPPIPVSAAPSGPEPPTPVPAAPSGPEPSTSVAATPSGPEPSTSVAATPSGPEPSTPVATAPSGPEPSTPVAAAPSGPESSTPVAATPLGPQPSIAVAATPSGPEPSTPVASAPSGPEPSTTVAAAPSGPEPSTPVSAAPSVPETPVAAASPGPEAQFGEIEIANMQNKFLDSILKDSSYLIDVSRGYEPEDNLKEPIKAFKIEEAEAELFPIIETMSGKLFNIVQKMTNYHKKEVETVMKERLKGVLPLTNPVIKTYLCQVRLMEAPSKVRKKTKKAKPKPSKRARQASPVNKEKNVCVVSKERLKMLRAVFDAGWKREVVLRSETSTGRKKGDVYYHSPDGMKLRSSKQVAEYLAKLRDTSFTVDNFSFAKVRISDNREQEIVRRATARTQGKAALMSKEESLVAKGELSKAVAEASTSKVSNKESQPVCDPETESLPDQAPLLECELETVESQPLSDLEGLPTLNMEIGLAPNVETRPASTVGTRPKHNVEARRMTNVETRLKHNVEARSKQNVETRPKPNVKARPKPNVEAQSVPGNGASSGVEIRLVSDKPVKATSTRESIQPPKRYSEDAGPLPPNLKRSKVQGNKQKGSNPNKGRMQMGMLPPKYPVGVEDTSGNLSDDAMEFEMFEEAAGFKLTSVNDVADDSLFQISALRQSSEFDVDSMHDYVMSQKREAQKLNERKLSAPQPQPFGSSKRRKQVTIPCSVQCPGMEGLVPNMHCTRCFCLFHAECLGLSPNLVSAFSEYVCSSCTEEETTASTTATAGAAFNQHNFMERQLPELAPMPFTGIRRPIAGPHNSTRYEQSPVKLPRRIHEFPIGGSMRRVIGGKAGAMNVPIRPAPNYSGQRGFDFEGSQFVPMTGTVKPGRGGGGSFRNFPQLNNGVSISPVQRIQDLPPMPKLLLKGTPNQMQRTIQSPVMGMKHAVPKPFKSTGFRLSHPPPPPKLKGPIPKNMAPVNSIPMSGSTMKKGRGGVPNVQEGMKTVGRYLQQTCTIGGKTFVVLSLQKPKVNKKASAVGNRNDPTMSHSYSGPISIESGNIALSSAVVNDTFQNSSMRGQGNYGQVFDEYPMEEILTAAPALDEAFPMNVVQVGMGMDSSNGASLSYW